MSKRDSTRDGIHSSLSKRESTRAATSLSRVTRNQSNPSLSRGATPYRLEQASEIRENEFDFPSNIHNNTMVTKIERPVDKDPNELLKWLKKEDNIFVKAKSKQILTPDNFSMAFSRQIDENKLKLKEFTKKSEQAGLIDANRLYSLFQKRKNSGEEDKSDPFANSNNTDILRPKSGSQTMKKVSDGDTYFRLKNMGFATHNNILVGKPSVEINSKIFRISPDEEQLFNDQMMHLETPEKTFNEQTQNPENDEDVVREEMASPALSNGIGSIPEDVPIASNYGSQNSLKNEPNLGRKGSQREIDNALKYANVFAIYKPSTGTSYKEPYNDRKKNF